jgi:16S rRNA (cytidine1402-2'-O)-methyltransferase
LPTDSFQFLGFLPARSGERRTLLESVRDAQQTTVVYEAPHRIAETMKDIVELLGSERPVVLARELTKVHEEFIRGDAADVLARVQAHETKGEITLLISKGKGRTAAVKQNIAARLEEIMREKKIDEKAALKVVAKEQGLSKSEAYRELQRKKNR